MTSPSSPEQRLAQLEQQNRLLLEQTEALRGTLAERNEEIIRLSRLLLEQDPAAPPPARQRGWLARLFGPR